MKKNKRIGDIICYVSFAIGIIGLLITQSTRVGMIIFTIGLVISCPFYRKYNKARKAVIKQGEEKE
ncbi:hypothetical protein NR996_01915 [Lactobacillus rodentium]|uniref:Uncharacterized protein n=1 Tax=Lactobacillus rodentium TaxID=947835 RepID=A0A2Z6TCI2_9LACO|nr:hypothetical protein [Lactobacillus rodentium]MCR1894168.1 hypothetical protein [Lactobacillus rodentium]GBG04465.1 hypothetical protein LrDSM24759_03790 [Lactobacillus rodentium]